MNVFNRIIRDIQEVKEGRIRRFSGHWLLVPGETLADGSHEIPGKPKSAPYLDRFVRISTDKHGRKMRLVSTQAVHCPNQEYAIQFASLKEDCVCLSVPLSFCRKCPHYRTAKASRRKYATCGYKASDNPAADTAKEFTGLLSEATRKAKELMR